MKYIKGFDGLRAISILAVLFLHLGIYNQVNKNLFLKENFRFLTKLYLSLDGVMIFFSISGFLITLLLLNEKKKNGKINLKNFFARRFLRLLPALVVFFIILCALMASGFLSPNYAAVGLSFLYLYNYVPFCQYYTHELAHTWSLGVEEQFYFLWPFLINRLIKLRTCIIFAGLIIAVCLIWRESEFAVFNLHFQRRSLEHYNPLVVRWFIPACLPIMIGALTGMVLFAKFDLLKKRVSGNIFFLLFAVLIYIIPIFIPHFPTTLKFFLSPLSVSLVLLWIYFNQDSLLVRLLEFQPISFLGKISYGVYVYQGLFLRNGPGGPLTIQQFPLNLILLFITSVLSYYLIEKRILLLKDRFK